MNKTFKITLVLSIISMISALLIAGLNQITSPIIISNNEKKEVTTSLKIFSTYDSSNSSILIDDENDDNQDYILKATLAKNSEGITLGYIYKVSGKNTYGVITLLVGISSTNELVSVEFLENGQSYASDVANHVSDNYSEGLDDEEISDIDVKCGATYGARLVKNLVTAALTDAKGRN